MSAMHAPDLGIIVVYILGSTALGAWFGSKARGLKGYFLGVRSIPAWAVMISIVATETDTATFLSPCSMRMGPGPSGGPGHEWS